MLPELFVLIFRKTMAQAVSYISNQTELQDLHDELHFEGDELFRASLETRQLK